MTAGDLLPPSDGDHRRGGLIRVRVRLHFGLRGGHGFSMQAKQAPILLAPCSDRRVVCLTVYHIQPRSMAAALLRGGLERGLQELASLPARLLDCLQGRHPAICTARWPAAHLCPAAAACRRAACHLPRPPWPTSILQTQAAEVDTAVKDLLRSTSVLSTRPTAQGGPLPALATLPPSAHLNLLLLLRAAPHRFTAAQQAALLQGLHRVAAAGLGTADPQHASLVQLLAAEAEGSLRGLPPPAAVVPPCPPFLYTAQPCFPWAPVLADAAAAAALHKRQLKEARRRAQEEAEAEQARGGAAGAAGEAAGGKRPAEEPRGSPGDAKRPRSAAPPAAATTTAGAEAAAEAELDAAVAAVKGALAAHAAGGAGELTAMQPPLRAALDVLLTHAASGSAAGSEALEEAGLASLDDDSLLLLLLSDLITPASSFARCRAAAAGLLLPRLAGLAGPAPRDLAAAAQHVGEWPGAAICCLAVGWRLLLRVLAPAGGWTC